MKAGAAVPRGSLLPVFAGTQRARGHGHSAGAAPGRRWPARPERRGLDGRPCLHSTAAGVLLRPHRSGGPLTVPYAYEYAELFSYRTISLELA